MAYYLSKKSREKVLLVLKLLKGETKLEIPTSEPKYILSMLQSARQEYPELENWRWRRTTDSIILTSTSLIKKVQKVDKKVDYLDLVQSIMADPNLEQTFTNLHLNEKERDKLSLFANKIGITISISEGEVTVHGKKSQQDKQESGDIEG